MTGRRLRISAALIWILAGVAPGAAAQARPPEGTLHITVKDPSGAVIPAALVEIGEIAAQTDGEGIAVVRGLVPGRHTITISFPGFQTAVVTGARIRQGENRRDVTLAIAKVDENVSVGRDAATAASDPNSDRFGSVLTKEQIDALPDDPDEMEKVLQEMAGPGGTIRVDGFRGGKLPPKAQIRSIRFASGMFAAENHGGGLTFVDIHTQPGMGPLRGGMDITFRDGALNARNAFQEEKGSEQTQQYTLNVSGTILKNRTSFSLSAGGASLYDSASVFAAVPEGRTTASIRRPSDRLHFNGRLDHAINASHTLRATFQQNSGEQQNLGVGTFDLADRAFGRTTRDSTFRVSESGAWGRAWFGESRLQVRWSGTDASPVLEAPTTRVLDAFTSGGAQQAGGRRSTEVEWATNIDWARGRHAVRMGALVEGGSYRSDSHTNYLGTYTFASLADYEAGRPATYSRRTGDPLVEYSHWQAGVFIQDDWRVRKNLTLSAGLRQELQTHLGDGLNLAPRAGFTWAPFKHGKTTIRAGGGIFYDWLEAETYEQTLRVDGVRQQDLIVRDPGYPEPFDGGFAEVLPTSKYLLAPGLDMPKRAMVNVGLTQQLTPAIGVNVNVMHMRGSDRFRGRNVNAPLNGARPNPLLGNVTQVESTARMQNDSVNTALNINVPARRMFIFANYSWIRQRNDADGPFSLPADSYDPDAEWARAGGVPRHVASAVVNTPVAAGIRFGLSFTARSGTPYNITTGRDDNGDTMFNDRPAGVGRNTGTTRGMWDVGVRVSYAFGFGERTAGGPAGGPVTIIQRVGGPGGGGDMLNALGGGGAENKRVRFELIASAQNVLNRVNPIGYSGVLTSPFFGRPTAAMPGRRIDLGLRVAF